MKRREMTRNVSDFLGAKQKPVKKPGRRRLTIEALEDRVLPAFSFAASVNFGTGARPAAVAIADVNQDGHPDLIVANSNANSLSVLLGDGTGGFAAAVNIGVGSRPLSVVVADFNGDGKMDLATANSGADSVSVLLGNGDGTFGAAASFSVGSTPVALDTGDFNSDMKPDLVVANSNSNNVSLLLGDGSGGFAAATNASVDSSPHTVAVGDFNSDGKLDVVTANTSSNDVSVLLNNGSGGFGAATNYSVGTAPFSVVVGDFNGDGKADLATANYNTNNVSVLLNNGSGSFGGATNFAVGTNPYGIATGDLNGDGQKDLVTANFFSDNVSVLRNTFLATAPTITSPTSTSITSTGATLGGNVTSDGTATITERGVVYAKTSDNANPQIGGAGVTKVTATGTTGVFTVNVTNLAPGVGYSFVAYATNAAGTTYTSPVSTFSTPALVPTVTTPTVASLTSTTVTLGGNVTSDGGATITERGVLYALTSDNANPQLGGTGVTKVTASGTTGVFTANVTGLTAGSAYSFVAYATNSVGTTYTTPVSTFVAADQPTVTTPTSASITATTATLGGNVTADGGAPITERGVVYAKTSDNSNPQIGGFRVTKVTASGTTGVFTVDLTGLAGGTGYSFVAYAINSTGTTYTTPVSTFSTVAVAPTITTPTVTSITGTTATLGGNVTSDGGATITERGVLYALTSDNANPQLGGTGVTKVTASGTTGVFTANVTGLTAGSAYSFVAYATNSVGTTYTTPVSTFSTLAGAPTVTTPTVTNITSTTVTLGGNVTSPGGATITERGVLYALTSDNANPQLGGTGVTKVTASGTTGVFTANVTGLTPGSAYSFVAYATNSVGTTYTTPVSTFVAADQPTVTTPTSASITATTATLGGNVTADGGAPITERGVVYAKTSVNGNPQIGGNGVTKVTASGTTGVFTVDLTGLAGGTGYSFVAYAINSTGTTYTTPVSTFMTMLVLPTVTSPTYTNLSNPTTALLGGNVTSDGGATITERGIVYSLTSVNANPQIGGTGVTKVTTTGTTGAFTVLVSGLTVGSGYSFAAYATNSQGTTYTTPVSTFQHGAPTITANTISIADGGTLVLGPSNFNTIDPDSSPAELTYTVSGITGGRFELVASPGTPITNFTQAQINAGQVQFVHNGGGAMFGYSLSVSDGTTSTVPAPGSVSFNAQLHTNLTVSQPLSKAPGPITPVFAIITNFTGYTGPFPFITGSFFVEADGNYSANLRSPAISNGFYLLRGIFSPSTGTPTTPLSNFIVFSQQLTNTVISGVSLQAGVQYSYVFIFSTGNSPVDFTITGPGPIHFGLVPQITSSPATNVTTTGATLGGNITSDGGNPVTQRGVIVALTSVNPNPTLNGLGITKYVDASTGTGPFSLPVTGLSQNSAYSFVSYVTTTVGTAYSPVATFTTLPVTTIQGTVFLDYQADGVQNNGDPPLAGRTVFLDLNDNGVLDLAEPAAVTDATGAYLLTNLPSGSFRLREQLFPGDKVVAPGSGSYPVTLTTGTTLTGRDFANRLNSTVVPVSVSSDLFGSQNPDAPTALTSGLYEAALGRAGSDTEKAYWVNRLNEGLTRTEIAHAFQESLEQLGLQVDSYYRTYLQRDPDADGRAFWIAQLQAGVDANTVVVDFLTSAEYQQSHGGDDVFVKTLYQEILGRDGEADGIAYWQGRIQAGESRADVVREFLTSGEAYVRAIDSFYAQYLQRQADAAGQAFWLDALQAGRETLMSVAVQFLACDEFFANAKLYVA